jgi:hypothetical protein
MAMVVAWAATSSAWTRAPRSLTAEQVLPHDLGELGQGGLRTSVLRLVVVAWHSWYQVDRVPSPTGDLSQEVRVRRRRRRWTTAALMRRVRRERERGRAGEGGREAAQGLGVALEASNQIDCQLIQSFPVREYISSITKISKESNPSMKRKPTSHDYKNGAGPWCCWPVTAPIIHLHLLGIDVLVPSIPLVSSCHGRGFVAANLVLV